MNNNQNNDLLVSALAKNSNVFPNEEIIPWINKRRKACLAEISVTSLEDLESWEFKENKNKLSHKSGRFFNIEGIEVLTNWGIIQNWNQPIINQPEVGILGLISKKINKILHFLVQAKIEPGNINIVQLSPTLQATKSNYERIHGGNPPKYLEFFRGDKNSRTIIDQLQSEQGSRFLKKRNRNIIIEIDEKEDIEVDVNFIWLTLGQIKKLLEKSHIINMDTRSIISCINFYPTNNANLLIQRTEYKNQKFYDMAISAVNNSIYINNFCDLTSWLTEMKSNFYLEINKKSLIDLNPWAFNCGKLEREDKKFFSIIGVNVEIENREVIKWDQPMIKPFEDGVIIFLVTKFKGIYHFLVQAKLEAGNLDKFEIGPTIQCKIPDFEEKNKKNNIPFLNLIRGKKNLDILFDSCQSEEGGRFYRESNRHLIVEIDKNQIKEIPKNYIWISLNQLLSFNKYNNFLNISARSLISIIRYS